MVDHTDKYNSNVSSEAAVELADIVENIDFENYEYSASDETIHQIEHFLNEKFNITSLVQLQSYCATTNDHTSLSSINENMKTLIEYTNTKPELQNLVKPLVIELISSHNIKVFYRCLGNEYPVTTIPAIDLLKAIISFDNGTFVDPFLEVFDLSLRSIKDLFYPTKASAKLSSRGKAHTTVRSHMSYFWIALLSNASPLTRSDLLSNQQKINHTWIKFITEFDDAKLLRTVFKFFDEKVLNEKAYRKQTKCKLIGDFTLSKLVELYRNADVASDVNTLLTKITTDEVSGLLFHDYRTWFNSIPLNCLPPNSNFNSAGVIIEVGEEKFKINNKIIFKVLTSLHPWSNSLESKLVANILTNAPELSAPYTVHLFNTNGSHDPKLTSFYIGQTLLLTRITQLPIPSDFVQMVKKLINDASQDSYKTVRSGSYLTSKILLEVICPSSLNRSSLTAGLTSKNQMIRHFTVQLMVSIIQKFSKVYKLLKFNENSMFTKLSIELKDSIINIKLPDTNAIVGAINECLKETKVNKMLLLNFMKVIESYYDVLDITISFQLGSFKNILGINLEETESTNLSIQSKLTDIDVILFNSYLSLTATSAMSNQQQKWWNISKGSKNSLFTTIAKLPYDLQYREDESSKQNIVVDSTLINKVVEVLSNFIDDSISFEDYKSSNTSVFNSQAWAIVLSMLNTFNQLKETEREVIDAICKVLDESISRAIRTPYKYYDVVTNTFKVLGLQNTRVSAFFVVLCEQSKFVKPEYNDQVNQWIQSFIVYMFLLGESLPIMKSIFKEYRDFEVEFDASTYESFVNSNNFATSFSNLDVFLFTPLNKLKSKINTLIPKSDIEIIAILDRIESIINFDVDLKTVEDLLLDLVSLYGNYTVHKYAGFIDDQITINNVDLLGIKYWKPFFITAEEASNKKLKQKVSKKYFVMGLLNEFFMSLWDKQSNINMKKSLRDLVFNLIDDRLGEVAVQNISEYLWVLTEEQIKEFIINKKTSQFNKKLLEIAIKKEINFDIEDVMKYCTDTNNEKILDLKSCSMFAKLSKCDGFNDSKTLTLIQLAKTGFNKVLIFNILQKIGESEPNKIEFISEQLKGEFTNIADSIEGFKFLQFLSIKHVEFRTKLYAIAKEYINSVINHHNDANQLLNIYIKSLSLYIQELPTAFDEVKDQIGKLVTLDSVRNDAGLIFSPEMTSIVFTLFRGSDDMIIKTWLHRAVLYITKVFAETSDSYLGVEFVSFLKCLQESFRGSIWKYVNKSMMNSQLEVILSKEWVKHVDVLKYTTWIIMTGSKNVVESVKLVNIFLNNLSNVLVSETIVKTNIDKLEEARYYTTLILSYLFKMNLKQLSSYDMIFKIVKLYRGTTRACDLILKDLIMAIEQETGESWIQFVSNWDLVDDWLPLEDRNSDRGIINEVPELIIDTPGLTDNLTVNLHKAIIEKTVREFDPSIRTIRTPKLQHTIETQNEDFFMIEEFYELKKIDLIECYGEVLYDFEFLLLLIVNNEDLFKISQDTVRVNILALIDTGLLQLVICGLAHDVEEVHQISKRIISSVLFTIEDDIKNVESRREKKQDKIGDSSDNIGSVPTFKERSAFKVYLGNLLYTLEEKRLAKIESGKDEQVSKLFIIFLSYLVPILSNPAHFLYEKAYRFILGGSKYKDFEIPMYRSIMVDYTRDEHAKGNGNDDADYYRQLQWVLNTLRRSITSKEDLKILRRNDVIEQLLTLLNSPFINSNIQENILQVFERIVRLENGADLLIRSYALLSFVESKELSKKNKVWEKYVKLTMKTIASSECGGKDKRSREWCSDDFEGVVKRVCM